MVEAGPVMRAARNAFGVLMVALLFVYLYQFAFTDAANQRLFDIWLLGALVYWLSQWYYRRQDTKTAEPVGNDPD